MSDTLSAFYFDIRKDSLYCDAADAPTRRACRSVLEHLLACLGAWMAPILPFTAEEAWEHRPPSLRKAPESIHLAQFPAMPQNWQKLTDPQLWRAARAARRVVLGALEAARQKGAIGSSLEAAPLLYVQDEKLYRQLDAQLDMAELCITSQLQLRSAPPPKHAFTLPDVPGCGALVAKAQGKKCARSWRIRADVGSNPAYPDLSARCAAAVASLRAS